MAPCPLPQVFPWDPPATLPRAQWDFLTVCPLPPSGDEPLAESVTPGQLRCGQGWGGGVQLWGRRVSGPRGVWGLGWKVPVDAPSSEAGGRAQTRGLLRVGVVRGPGGHRGCAGLMAVPHRAGV